MKSVGGGKRAALMAGGAAFLVFLAAAGGWGYRRQSIEARAIGRLRELDADFTIVPAGLAWLGNLAHRCRLPYIAAVCWVEGVDQAIDDRDLALLSRSLDLRYLNLDGGQVTDAGLAHLRRLHRLHSLHLDDTRITDAGLRHLKGLTNLEHLSLEGTRVTPEGIAALKQALPDLEVFTSP